MAFVSSTEGKPSAKRGKSRIGILKTGRRRARSCRREEEKSTTTPTQRRRGRNQHGAVAKKGEGREKENRTHPACCPRRGGKFPPGGTKEDEKLFNQLLPREGNEGGAKGTLPSSCQKGGRRRRMANVSIPAGAEAAVVNRACTRHDLQARWLDEGIHSHGRSGQDRLGRIEGGQRAAGMKFE